MRINVGTLKILSEFVCLIVVINKNNEYKKKIENCKVSGKKVRESIQRESCERVMYI